METTCDRFLDHALNITQPRKGFRAGTDTVLLAAAVVAHAGERVLDAGAGVGTAALCLAHRVSGVEIDALERESALLPLLEGNIAANGLAGHVAAIAGDLAAPPDVVRQRVYDHVMSNPPYFDPRDPASTDGLRARARTRGDIPVPAWCGACLRRLKPGGSLTLVHRAAALPDILSGLADQAGNVTVLPLLPRADVAAKGIVVRAVKGARAPLTLLPGFVMHEADGALTAAAAAVLRGRATLVPHFLAASTGPAYL